MVNRRHKDSLGLGMAFCLNKFLDAVGQKFRLAYWSVSIFSSFLRVSLQRVNLLTFPFGSVSIPALSPSLSPPALFNLLSSSCPFPHPKLPPPSFIPLWVENTPNAARPPGSSYTSHTSPVGRSIMVSIQITAALTVVAVYSHNVQFRSCA